MARSFAVDQRWVAVANAINMRDVGGLPCTDGSMTRSGRLLRSGSLHRLEAEDAVKLIGMFGLDTVLDLRTSRELALEGPSVLAEAGIATTHLPLIREDQFALPESDPLADPAEALTHAYQGYLVERGHHLVTAARLVASSQGATLVHCAAGKDRTGVTIAVLLDAIGVDRAAVVEDYALTNQRIEQVVAALRIVPGYAEQIARVPDERHLVQPVALRALLDDLDDQFGGAAGWLQAYGLDDAILAGLRCRLVTSGLGADPAD